jgi:hypothetical protein
MKSAYLENTALPAETLITPLKKKDIINDEKTINMSNMNSLVISNAELFLIRQL